MRYAISTPNFGTGLTAAGIGDLAALAEQSGWDGFFLWDHLFAFEGGPVDVVDPYVALTVAATRTSRIVLGPGVTPLPRRRPQVLARQSVSLDVLSGGQFVMGVGSGAFPFEWNYCGEETDPVTRGDMLDEGLQLLAALWTAQPVRHRGAHYRVDGEEDTPDAGWAGLMHPPPAQRPRIPIWVAGTWPGRRPFRRAARWDGVMPMRADGPWTVRDTHDVTETVRRHGAFNRPADLPPFHVAVPGETEPGDDSALDRVAAHGRAGATWWVEAVHPWRYGHTDGAPWPTDQMTARIAAGPPR